MVFRRGILVVCCCVMTVTVAAQRKELSQARSYIKSGKDLEKAEKLMTDLLAKDAANRTNERIYQTWFEAVAKQYEAANEKLYLHQQYDTAAFFGLTRRLYAIGGTLDSLEAKPDNKGRVKLKNRERHAELLDRLRPNLYFGGTYFFRKGDYVRAYDFFNTYITADSLPLFTGYHYMQHDTRIPEAAFWAVSCGNKLQDTAKVLQYHSLALRYEAMASYTLQYVCEARHQQGQIETYLATLKEGFRRFPAHPYFFPRLIDYYMDCQQPDSALAVADQALQTDADNQLFLLAKSMTLLNMERYDECIIVSQRLIALNDTISDAYFNVATSYLNKAFELEQKASSRKQKATIKNLYEKARPYMETYRRLMPEEREKWAPGLYRIYLNLNLGKQFEEIDRVMKKLP